VEPSVPGGSTDPGKNVVCFDCLEASYILAFYPGHVTPPRVDGFPIGVRTLKLHAEIRIGFSLLS